MSVTRWGNVGPASQTVCQHYTNVVSKSQLGGRITNQLSILITDYAIVLNAHEHAEKTLTSDVGYNHVKIIKGLNSGRICLNNVYNNCRYIILYI